jgi:RNA polymerase sigma-70 factor, ECF subfamily
VASVARQVGDLATAEDAVQEAFLAAVTRWAADGIPDRPVAWLVAVARRRALDRIRREAHRPGKEIAAVREVGAYGPPALDPTGDDQLSLIFTCCHPALDPVTRIALTLRSVCGLSVSEVASVLLLAEPTAAKRLVRARRKIRESHIVLRTPQPENLMSRLDGVLRVIYLIFTQGHKTAADADLVHEDLCGTAVRLARTLHDLLPGVPEIKGLLALLLLTDARRPGRIGGTGSMIPLPEQDRARWDQSKINEGEALVEQALRAGQPGPYQLHAAIAACHSTATRADETDWRQIALLYGELLRYEPTAVIETARGVAVAMADGPDRGLAILDDLAGRPELAGWPQPHIARADLLRRLGRRAEARRAYSKALELGVPEPERAFIAAAIERCTP